MKVLVADDDLSIRDSVKNLLESYGHAVVCVRDGIEVIEVLERLGPFDLLITDLMMPKMWGTEVLKQVRQHPTFKDLPVILQSGRNVRDEVHELGGVFVDKRDSHELVNALEKFAG